MSRFLFLLGAHRQRKRAAFIASGDMMRPLPVQEQAVKAPEHTLANVAQVAQFDTVIDVRSPSEYAEDHIPGAINCPVLDDDERIRVGTLYTQVSPFEARKIGAVLVARNIARHLEEQLNRHPKSWRPLIYCWRGGQRSGAFSHVLREIGWSARRLEGGYKSWRHHVIDALETLPPQFELRVVCAPTGSGKSRLLEAMARQGAQVLHLEALAAHKGSVLGDLPDSPQPGQKMFETRLYQALAELDPARPVFVEAESRRIGQLRLPQALFAAMGEASLLRIDAEIGERVDFLLRDYAYLCEPEALCRALERLKEFQGGEAIARWQALARAGDFRSVVGELLARHYDPLYERSQRRKLPVIAGSSHQVADNLSAAGIDALAARIVAVI
jgi:tRNA 2-selenouridine synthase